jgi:hypothetical protein
MKHFSLADWADFARHVGEAEQTAAMQRHLEDGCKKCERLARLWHGVQEAARREAEYEPLQGAVRIVKAAYATRVPKRRKNRISEIAELVFDSLQQPLPVGVRSVEVTARKLLYRRGSLQIDVSLEPLEGAARVSVAGQVLDSQGSHEELGEKIVVMLCGREQLAQTRTNSFGEFQLECESRKSLQLAVWMNEEREIFIPLDELSRRNPRAR